MSDIANLGRIRSKDATILLKAFQTADLVAELARRRETASYFELEELEDSADLSLTTKNAHGDYSVSYDYKGPARILVVELPPTEAEEVAE
ncbi:hypothetical protein MM326_13720 [Alkalihalobacillus sp. LMS6]|jgi:hypothetical protein|uniref:hypothetical protein n=1 Tax=Alkalihalobacillus sp. LMS6 TaxID=2924034 RepID=UPI0020D15A67|nr:hypothetical protein [Alkalihalobacillus sp. LMS6]UTR05166.1 hypothetical protein MM326_13720 [Alkalihalobacillus sp. LMS6]